MNIGIDATKSVMKEKTGIENLSYQLILNLQKLNKNDSFRLYADSTLPKELLNKNTKAVVLPFPLFWHSFRFPVELMLNKPDVLLVPGYGIPLMAPVKTIAFIHDLAFKYFPEAYSTIDLYLQEKTVKRIARQAAHIIFISESTRDDFFKYYSFDKKNTSVIPLACDTSLYQKGKDTNSSGPGQPYFFVLGRLEDRKNICNIVKSFYQFKRSGHYAHKLLLVGKEGHGYGKIMQEIESDKTLKEDVEVFGYIGQDKLPALYQRAEALVFCSRYEGFGLPILEAFNMGTPVIASAVSSMPEVAGNAAILVEPNDVAAMASAMKTIVLDDKSRKELVEKGQERAQLYSWKETARKTLAVIHKVYEEL